LKFRFCSLREQGTWKGLPWPFAFLLIFFRKWATRNVLLLEVTRLFVLLTAGWYKGFGPGVAGRFLNSWEFCCYIDIRLLFPSLCFLKNVAITGIFASGYCYVGINTDKDLDMI
jgi:hypothetical protein